MARYFYSKIGSLKLRVSPRKSEKKKVKKYMKKAFLSDKTGMNRFPETQQSYYIKVVSIKKYLVCYFYK